MVVSNGEAMKEVVTMKGDCTSAAPLLVLSIKVATNDEVGPNDWNMERKWCGVICLFKGQYTELSRDKLWLLF